MEVLVPQLAWFGDSELKLNFPEEWTVSVQVMEGHGKKSVDEEEIVYVLRNPVGTKPLSTLSKRH
jgi:nickel-dependent lactate racemase